MSLLELLIVGGVLIAILAIAIPISLRSIDERELSATEENFASELLKARAQAQESGRPVEVVVMGMPSRIVLRYFQARADGARSAGQHDRTPGADQTSPPARSNGRGVRDAWWEESPIASSVRVANVPPVEDGEFEAETSLPEALVEELEAEPAGSTGSGEPMRVAVFMPDGSILFAASLLLMHENGLQSRLSVDPWTGQPAIDRAKRGTQPSKDGEVESRDWDEDSFDDLAEPVRIDESGADRGAPRRGPGRDSMRLP